MARVLSATTKVNVLVGIVVVALAGLFWSQRSYTTEHGGTFADPVILVLGALGIVLVILGLIGRDISGGDDQDLERLPIMRLAIAVAVLAAWVLTLPYLGYVVGGIIFFVLTALLMRKERPSWKGVLLDVAVAVVLLLAFNYVFSEYLYIRLPELGL
ncbi:tripartite tricarboxylate transporter TctB family protein [Georgenia sp. Z1344]|uniref:tripartite tricarboxylate transporter TctB family protein n=1 Tax=Georgenia sp. Z1344 TaxID=3416706 RepID=UPI003CFA063E